MKSKEVPMQTKAKKTKFKNEWIKKTQIKSIKKTATGLGVAKSTIFCIKNKESIDKLNNHSHNLSR